MQKSHVLAWKTWEIMPGLAENLRKPREIVAFYSDSMLIFSRTAEILYSASG